MPIVFPEDRCDVCHQDALLNDSDLVLCQCSRELWVHDRCVEAGRAMPEVRCRHLDYQAHARSY
jgi:hypothetical protein